MAHTPQIALLARCCLVGKGDIKVASGAGINCIDVDGLSLEDGLRFHGGYPALPRFNSAEFALKIKARMEGRAPGSFRGFSVNRPFKHTHATARRSS